MAYISTSEVKRIRETLKQALPEFKFSVKKGSGSLSVDVAIMAGPLDLTVDCAENGHRQLNHYYLNNYHHSDLYEAVHDIIKRAPVEKHYNNSDAMTDYFDVAYYYHINVGAWDKPYQIKQPKKPYVKPDYATCAQTALAFTEMAA